MLIIRICYLFILFFFSSPSFSEPIPEPPYFDVHAYILIDADSGRILAQQNADARVPPASITKMMTSYLVDEAIAEGRIERNERVHVSHNAVRVERVRMFHGPTTEPTVDDLIHGVAVQSANDASVALAEHIAGSEARFVAMMNAKAKELDMKNTNFENPNGLTEPNHYSSARDLAILARAVIKDYPETYPKYSKKSFYYKGQRKVNPNLLLWWDESVDGIKTGYTRAAKFCLASSAKRGDMRLIAVVLGSKSVRERTAQSQELLDYGFRYYETRKVHDAHQPVSEARVWRGSKRRIEVGLQDPLYVTLPKGDFEQLDVAFNMKKNLHAPVAASEQCGALEVMVGKQVIAQKPLIALESVKEGGWFSSVTDRFQMSFR